MNRLPFDNYTAGGERRRGLERHSSRNGGFPSTGPGVNREEEREGEKEGKRYTKHFFVFFCSHRSGDKSDMNIAKASVEETFRLVHNEVINKKV